MVSYTGTWLQVVAQGWLVLELTNSAFQVGLVTALGSLPILLFTLYGGVVADRVNRRQTVLLLQSLLALEAVALAILVLFGHVTVGRVAALAAFAGLVTAFEVPVRQAMVAELVGREHLMNALALQSSAFNLARVAGPAIAGLVIVAWGTAAAFSLNAVSFIAVIWALAVMRVPHQARTGPTMDVLEAFREGARYVWYEPWPRALILLIGVTTVFGFSFFTMLPVYARNVLGTGASGYGALVSSVGLGALVGALTLASFGGKLRRRLSLLSAGLFGTGLIATALAPGYAVAFGTLFLSGCFMVVQSITANTLLQSESPDHLRGRVMGFYSFVVLGMAPFGAFQIGWTSERLGVRPAFALGGVACLAAAGWLWHSLRRRVPGDAQAGSQATGNA